MIESPVWMLQILSDIYYLFQKVEDFYRDAEDALNDLNQLRQHLLDNRFLRVSEIDRALNTSSGMNESTRILVHSVMESGRLENKIILYQTKGFIKEQLQRNCKGV